MKYKKAIILGAGFSYSFIEEIPTIKALLSYKKMLDKKSNFSQFLSEIFQKANISQENLNSLGNLQKQIYNIENIATIILSKNNFINASEKNRYEEIKRELLNYIYSEINDATDLSKIKAAEHLEVLKNFVNYCINENILLISFNYDMLIEMIMLELQKENKDYKYILDYDINLSKNVFTNYKSIDAYTDEVTYDSLIPHFSNETYWQNMKRLKLLKPHGSFNWFKLDDEKESDINNIHIYWERYFDQLPVFIPMTYTKYRFIYGSLFNILWKRMINYLEVVEEISFIGYSFPKTDMDNLCTFLKYKDKIKSIVVYSKEEQKELSTIFKDVVVSVDAKDFVKNNLKK